MSIHQTVQTELNRLICPSTDPQQITAADGPHEFVCDLVGLDSLGCAFTRFELRHAKLTNATLEQLKKTAEQLSTRLTYLLEAIRPVEIDADACVVQLRSVPPHKSDTGTSYYELHVARGGRLTLVRYQATPGQSRVAIPAQVTREVLGRLVQDFAAVA
ncbi:MAG: hypothetical protein JNM18_21460 [Planctomycetaceae bacterium]|nr:hypothetical protein [Planctomycetaceae bacterium]